ncbi:MAG: Flp pilus assembly complex ATPase component TadA, partial [Myxococcales bacterium]|nr:Flp pilus assembly complex ATPase component TadA [Myxococcales bacterium]
MPQTTPADGKATKARPRRRLGEILIESGILSEALLQRALESQRESRKRLGEVLIELQFVTEDDLARVLSLQLNIPYVEIKNLTIQPEAAELIDENIAEKFLMLPFAREGRTLHVAMADPLDYESIEQLQFRTKFNVQPHIATISDLQIAIRKRYSFEGAIEDPNIFDEMVRDISDDRSLEVIADDDGKDIISELKQKSEAAPIIKMVNMLLLDAVKAGVSDIHIDARERSVQVRQRIDGVLFEARELPKWMQGAVISRIKIMASLDIAERRVPQDGNIKIRTREREIDVRVSTLPTQFGEKAVLRLLDPTKAQIGLDQMGFPPDIFGRYKRLIESPQGLILITGPTGSGKTTTLYGSLHHINRPEVNIVTLEDPIEYNLAGINQVSLNLRAGLTFSSGLRSILRQDPDVILIGEMRDTETISAALTAAETGHLVLATLHTN